MEPGIWYLSRELVPFMPEHIRMPHKCGHVIKRVFDYALIDREELETKGQHDTFTMERNAQLLRALPSYCYCLSRLGTVLREKWRAEFGSKLFA